MYEIKNMLLAIIGIAAVSEIVFILSGGKNDGTGPDMLCGLCCAGCILRALDTILGMLM